MNEAMPTGTPTVTAAISRSTRVHLSALQAEFDVTHPVYALNWFNSRFAWLYNLYNLLAAPSVLKVGGVPFFKARVTTVLHGSKADCRSVLLIVRYPDMARFKTMLLSRYFQLVSLVRGLAVAQFTFGFSTRTDVHDTGDLDPQHRIPKGRVYAVHHYRLPDHALDQAPDIATRAAELAATHQVTLAFSSRVSARLYLERGERQPAAVDTIMHGCAVLQADSHLHLQQLVASLEYQELMSTTETSFVAMLDRKF